MKIIVALTRTTAMVEVNAARQTIAKVAVVMAVVAVVMTVAEAVTTTVKLPKKVLIWAP